MASKKFIWIGVAIILVGAFLVWLFVESFKPLPGQKQVDLGRKHVQIGKEVKYNSNPPTSGSHYADWIRAGIYGEPKDDRNLVHSLEHGYIVMSYKCEVPVIATPSETREKQSSSENEEIATATPSSGPRNDDQRDCDQRRNKLEEIFNKKGKRKLIVIPRSNLDTNFALTAWTYLDKFDSFDAKRVEKFIDTHRDNGPERTAE